MAKIVKMVAEKAGISTTQTETAVRTVAQFLKDKLPPGMAGQVDSFLTGNDPGGGSSGMADKIGGMFK